jgi:gamma-glutamyltranspeptidase/glutathione hydrolase
MHRRLTTLPFALACLPLAVLAADPPWLTRSKAGMVASDSPEASRVGAAVLADGGNAFDAAIATSFALAVTRPQSTGLGGGGFMVAYVAKTKRFVALDFREMAPASATPARFTELRLTREAGPPRSIYGGNAVGVPGQVAGLAEIQRRFATRSLPQLIRPALQLAREGFMVDRHYRGACREALKAYEKWPEIKSRYGRRLYQTLLGAGIPPKAGQRVTRPDLARALERIAERGPAAIYEPGMVGVAMVAAVNAAGGSMTLEDLKNYRVRERQPIRCPAGNVEIVSMPPPSSGGVCIVEMLNVLREMASEFTSLSEMRERGYLEPAYVDSLRHAFADRARWLGDPDFSNIPVKLLTSPRYAAKLARKTIGSNDDFGSPQLPDDRGTSHFCVADRAGNVVAITETINGTFGSLVVTDTYGVILNNQMDDFAANPGQPNLYGLIQGAANAVAPGKRPLSSMSPTIVVREGRPVLALGASGGPRIITSVLAVMVYVLELGMPLEEAMQGVRIHHQWKPDVVYFDQKPPEAMAYRLSQDGDVLSDERKTGIVQAIQFLPDGTMVGASDPRKGGRPAGVPAGE